MAKVDWGLKEAVEGVAKEIVREMAYDLKHIMQDHAISDHKNPTGNLSASISLRKQSDLVYWVGVNGGALKARDAQRRKLAWYGYQRTRRTVTHTQPHNGFDYGGAVNYGHAGAPYSKTGGTVHGHEAYLIQGNFVKKSIGGFAGSHWFDNAFNEFMAKEY